MGWCSHAYAVERKLVQMDRESANAIDQELWPTLDELLARVGLRLVPVSSSGDDVIARVTLVRDATGVSVDVADPRHPTSELERHVTRTESTVVLRETLAHVIASAVEPMAELPPDPSPEVASAPPAVTAAPDVHVDEAPSEPSRARSRFVLGPRSGVSWLTRDAVRPGFGLELGTRLAGRAEPALLLEAQGVLAHEVEREGVDAELRSTQLRLTGTLTALRFRRAAIDAGLAVGADVLSLDVRAGAPLHGEPSRRVQPVLGPRLVARVDVARDVAVLLCAGLDVDLAPRLWVIDRARQRRDLVDTGRLRPQAFAALEWTFARVRRAPARGAREP